MKSILVISIFMAAVIATTADRNDGKHDRQRRNHKKRHGHQNVTDALVASQHHGNHTQSIKNRTEEVVDSGVNVEMHPRNHTHPVAKKGTNDSVSTTNNSTHAEKIKMKREKKAKAKKSKMTSDVNTTTILPLNAKNSTDIHAHHKHEGKYKHGNNTKEEVASPPKKPSAVASDVPTKDATTLAADDSEASSISTKAIAPSSSTRTGGKGADPEKPWKEDNELEEVLAAVQAEFEAKKQSEEIMGQKLVNSATSFSIGIVCLFGLGFQTIGHQFIL